MKIVLESSNVISTVMIIEQQVDFEPGECSLPCRKVLGEVHSKRLG